MELCSTLAQQAHEPLIGTASRNAAHVVLAIPKREWLARVEDMPGEAGALAALIAPLKDQAMLSLRHCTPAERGEIWLFPHRYRFTDLTAADYPVLLEQVLNGDIRLPHEKVTGRRFILQCTHGLRDQCCALHGTAMLKALQQIAPPEIMVWEVSHLGGHRFAATAVVQPIAQWYGNLTPAQAPALMEAVKNKTVLLSHYRGNANFPAPLQVAEAWGWQQFANQGKLGKIHLVNPLIQKNTAEVEISLSVEGQEVERTALTLQGNSYEFTADCSGGRKDRLIWEITSAERMIHAAAP